MNKKGLIALGLAAVAYYRYNKMTVEEKAQMKDKVRNAGKSIWEKLPDELKNAVSKVKQKAEEFQS